MKPSRYYFFLFTAAFIWLVFLPSCKEKNNEYPPRNWSEISYTDNEIKLRDISVIYYENDHSLWLGSKGTEGLLYNDGYKWNTFNKNNTGISFDSVTSIKRDGNGKLWVGFRTGLATLDGNSWSNIEQFSGLNITSIEVEGIERIRVGIKGKSGGIASLNQGAWSFETLTSSSVPSGNITAMVSDNNQVLWAATADKGVIRLKNSNWENISSNLPLISKNFTAISKSPDGSIWAANETSEFIHFYNDSFTILNTGVSKPVTSIVTPADGNMWSSTTGAGLIQFNGKNWKSYTTANDAALPADDILCLSQGYPGYLIFSLPGGKLYTIKQ